MWGGCYQINVKDVNNFADGELKTALIQYSKGKSQYRPIIMHLENNMSQICDYELLDLSGDVLPIIIYVKIYGSNEILINKYQYNINIVISEAILRDSSQHIIMFS